MKKFLVAAAFMAFCSAGSALAQAPANTQSIQTTKTETKKDSHGGGSCCSKKSTAASAKSCGSESKAAGKSSCCQKGHTDAKVEEKNTDTKKN